MVDGGWGRYLQCGVCVCLRWTRVVYIVIQEAYLSVSVYKCMCDTRWDMSYLFSQVKTNWCMYRLCCRFKKGNWIGIYTMATNNARGRENLFEKVGEWWFVAVQVLGIPFFRV